MDRFSSLTVFTRVVESGSLASAAETLGLSAQMVGRHIKLLEEHLHVKLLNRTTRRQSLTEVGRQFYERSKTVLAELEAAESIAAESQAAPRGLLRINAPVSYGVHRLSRALPEYLTRFPEVTVDLSLNDRVVDLVEEGYDVAFRVGELSDSSLLARPLGPYRMVVCASPTYLARHGEPHHPSELSSRECLGFAHWGPRGTWTFRDGGNPFEVAVRGSFRANNGEALRQAALAGLGILMQPAILVEVDVAEGRLVHILAGYPLTARPMNLLFAPDRRITPKLRSFIDFAVEKFGDAGSSGGAIPG